MKAMQLTTPDEVDRSPLHSEELEIPAPGPDQLLLRVLACGVCRTDLHTVEGEISPPKLPVTPGHQVVAEVEAVGPRVEGWSAGERAGVPWLYAACGICPYCQRGEENLCERGRFTGFHVDGGYAEFMLSEAAYTLRIPHALQADRAAPLLCAGIIGYRSLRKADVNPGERLGLVGFGASAHLAIQVARHWGCEVSVFTRSTGHRELAAELGATWVGGAEDDPPALLDRIILFAPSGALVPAMLKKLRPGGTLAINAIHMSPIPELAYPLIYGERTLRSVANATYQDGVEFLRLAEEIPVRVAVQRYPLAEANQALRDLKHSAIDGAGVLIP